MTLAEHLKGVNIPNQNRPSQPIWGGPCGDGPQCGITFSLLSRFLTCRQRFRLLVVDGLRGVEEFNHKIFYGQAWHLCEQCLAASPTTRSPNWEHALVDYAKDEIKKYPIQAQQIEHWMHVCRVQFSLYIDYWSKHLDVKDRTPFLQERSFSVPYPLPSGRIVRLRGKWDAMDVIGKGKTAGVWVQENKTKGDIREEQLKRQLLFDLQTMLYTCAAVEYRRDPNNNWPVQTATRLPILGIRYNVVRRPLSGGAGSIRRHKARGKQHEETKEHFYGRVKALIQEAPSTYFMRWNVLLTPTDIDKFRKECLTPILEQLCLWYTVVVEKKPPYLLPPEAYNWRHPFGCSNSIDQDYGSEMDEYLSSGSTVGLTRTETLFGEL